MGSEWHIHITQRTERHRFKWVFKIKKDGTHCACLVAKGYNQLAGVDFQYNFAPVTSETTLCLMLLSWIVNDYEAEVADVQTAFLHGSLE